MSDVNIYNKPEPQVYRRLISECTSLLKESKISTSFTELQSNFLKDSSPKLKNLICLVKHWYQLIMKEQLPGIILKLSSSKLQQEVEFDVLMAYDILGDVNVYNKPDPQCKEKLGELLPPQYALELLTVYAWECGNGVTEFNTAQGFWTVLELITKYKQLQVHWTVYYDFQDQEISTYLLSQLTRAR
ncbi:hypothetical protein U0070_010784 [Myodes glareolus]|uniref:2'-5'-oligoadenylate synthetase 1 domain-containing protein n=1 Tax=Myodes glareolus TaxID=447135 RepID=A0AAW0H510_MYOGA